jgi:hypothetical protein
MYPAGDSNSDEQEPIVHVGQYPGHPGNCWKHGCSCTPLKECTECNDYHGISKRRHKRKPGRPSKEDIRVSCCLITFD